jgi:hypothetical protein
MPYTYRKQPPQLLRDIRSYYADYTLVDEFYSVNYNKYMWLNDIVSFLRCRMFIVPKMVWRKSYDVTSNINMWKIPC